MFYRSSSCILQFKRLHMPTIYIHNPKRYLASSIKPIKMAYDLYESSDTDKNATPLIIMHGLLGSKRNWRGLSRLLEEKLKRLVYTVDARNHGDSPHTDSHSSMHEAADIAALIRTQGLQQAFVLGHSMGGRAMMYLALKYPKLVERAVIIDVSPIELPRNFSRTADVILVMKNTVVPSDLPLAKGRDFAANLLKDIINDIELVNFITTNLRKRKTGEFYWAPNIDAIYNNLEVHKEYISFVSKLEPFKGPMLFICGTHSHFVNPAHWPDIQQMFPNATIEWLEAGHMVHVEQPDQFLELIIEFLR